jgi:hypothetical protein
VRIFPERSTLVAEVIFSIAVWRSAASTSSSGDLFWEKAFNAAVAEDQEFDVTRVGSVFNIAILPYKMPANAVVRRGGWIFTLRP